jgi:hypothetical protein
MISAITNEGKARFMVCREAITQTKLITFMNRLVSSAGRKKVYPVLGNLTVYHGKRVAEWLDVRKERMAVLCLPSCSPELSPDEHLKAI